MEIEDENYYWDEGRNYGFTQGVDFILDKIAIFYLSNKQEKDFLEKLFLYIKELRKEYGEKE
jgi:hypothetical protein